jgi:hypothetical protein
MSADRILQLKLIADVSEISGKMDKATRDVGRVGKAMQSLKGWAVPALQGLAIQGVGAAASALQDAAERGATLRDEMTRLDSLSVGLDIDHGKLTTALDEARQLGLDLGVAPGDEVATAFNKALTATGNVNKAMKLVEAAFDYARLKGVDFGTASEEVFDALIGGGDEAEEKLNVFGDTFWQRMRSFNSQYGNFAEDFALTDQGEWEKINTQWDEHMLNLGILLDNWILEGKKALIQMFADWAYIFTVGPEIFQTGIIDPIVEKFRAFINTLIGFWNSLDFSIDFDFEVNTGNGDLNKMMGLPQEGLNLGVHTGDLIPDIRPLAAGGIVTKPTLAMVGEAGPEAVIPLGSGGAGNSYHINVNAPASQPADVGRAVVEAIQAYERRAGGRWRQSVGRTGGV